MSKILKEVQKDLAGGRLTVTQFPVLRAIRVGGRIAKLVAPILGGLGGGLNMDDLLSGNGAKVMSDANINLNKALPSALNALADNLDPEAFAHLCVDLLASAEWTDGKIRYELGTPGSIETVFGGSIPDLFAALRAALEANDFFGLSAIGKLRGLLRAPAQKSPDGSTQT